MADNEINDGCSGFFDFRDNEESSFESQSVISSSISFLESPINKCEEIKPRK
ncbi:1426_t:CDS:2 [Entrophospora sp. SA101]|nr:1426_t:CDS:2 [Entrophospora sp. SA101]